MHLVQIANGRKRRVAVVREPELSLLREVDSVFALARERFRAGAALSELRERSDRERGLSYDAVYNGQSEWKLLAPIDVPASRSASCFRNGSDTSGKRARPSGDASQRKAEDERR